MSHERRSSCSEVERRWALPLISVTALRVEGPGGSVAHRCSALRETLGSLGETEELHIKVPLHFLGEDVAPGVKLQGGIMSHLMNEVDIACLPSNLPEYLEVDVSQLNLGESVKLSDIKAPEGVEITGLAHGGGHRILRAQ